MTIFEAADFLTGVFEAIMVFMLFETFCLKRDNIPSWIYGIGIFFLMILINISNGVFSYGILNAVGMSLSFFCMSFLYKGNIPLKAVISVLAFLLIVIVEIIVLFGISLIGNITVAEAVNNPSYRLFGIIVSKMLTFFIVNVISIKFKKRNFMLKTSYWILFLFMFATSIVTVFLIFKLSYNEGEAYMYNLSVLCSFGLLFSTFFSLYLYEHLAKQADIIRSQQQYEQDLKTQLKHLDEILITQNQIKKFKHDFTNYTIGLKAYLDKNDCTNALEYVNNLDNMFHSGNHSIETGNTALDAVLSTKKAIAESKNIDFTSKIQIPEHLAIDSIDMCVIFGNALDNAIEACEKNKNTDKKIDVTLICRDETVFCRIINTAPPRNRNIFMTTSKPDKKNHGFGLENIKTTLAKYDSEPIIEYTDTEFILKFVIFTKQTE